MIAKWLMLLAVLLMPCANWAGDTGTYRIEDYRVRLTPHSTGGVTLDYHQKWKVTGGHIPWITVGVPNNQFILSERRGAVRSFSNASEGGWAGVRLDLDKDYQPGESFEVGFSIEQSGLFHVEGENLTLAFTPGWYDRSGIGQLTVTMNIAAKMSDVKASPTPTTVEGQEIIWVRKNLAPGQQVRFTAAFPKVLMPSVAANISSSSQRIPPIVVFLIFAVCVVFFVWFATRRGWIQNADKGYSHGGSISYGGRRGGSSSKRSSGGGGGFGGSSYSCACACVSCACACACAGGGGAGCAKKNIHACPLCRNPKGTGL